MRNRASQMQDEASRGINQTIRNARTAASDAMSGAAETMSERFDEGMAGAREMFDRLGRALPSKETFGRPNPRSLTSLKGNRWSSAP